MRLFCALLEANGSRSGNSIALDFPSIPVYSLDVSPHDVHFLFQLALLVALISFPTAARVLAAFVRVSIKRDVREKWTCKDQRAGCPS